MSFWENFNLTIGIASNISKHVINVGGLYEKLWNLNFHHMRDIVIINNFLNINNQPIRVTDSVTTLFDPTYNVNPIRSGMMSVDKVMNDHQSTF